MFERTIDMQWIGIPDGQVTLEAGGYLAGATTFPVKGFAISRYPITNAQYGRFVAANGYQQTNWWVDDWAIQQREKWQQPHHWQSRDWNQPDSPVVGVSWFEAMAFCRWLSETTNQLITLPTEQQWQRAAQGEDGREYPWGSEAPTSLLCNWNRVVDETTPVTQYPAGASPYGVMDMSGNVWEWCLTAWEGGENGQNGRSARILRGGSWSSDSPLSLRVANRSPKDPNTRLDPAHRHHVTIGFRCIRL